MKALIAGGGIGGLTAALFLHRIGIEAEIFEQADEVRELGAGCTDSGDRNVTEEASNPSRCGGRLRVDDIHRFTADPGAGTPGRIRHART